MHKVKKVLGTASLALLMLVSALCISTDIKAEEGSFNTSGGTVSTKWYCELTPRTLGNAFYELNAEGMDAYQRSSDVVMMLLTLYCNASEHEKSNVVEIDVYQVDTYVSAVQSISTGKGTVYLEVSDNIYGSGSIRINH